MLDREIPFASVFGSWSRRAEAGLHGRLGPLGGDARDALRRQLLVELSQISDRALLAWFRSSRAPGRTDGDQQYRAFVECLARPGAIGRELPVLERLLDHVVDRWIISIGELTERYERDRDRLTAVIGTDPGSIVGLRAGLGDRHHGGRTVIGIRPERGPRLAYKPRSVAGEAMVTELLRSCTPWVPRRDAPRVVEGDGYGWMEWIEDEPVEDPERYWFNAGAMAAVLHVAGAHDLHGDNLVIAGDSPFAIDLECWNMPGYAEDAPGDRFAVDSVMQTGLFPNWFHQDARFAVESAGLFADRPRVDGRFVHEITGIATDAMDTIRVAAVPKVPSGIPRYRDRSRVAVDLDALLAGFEAATESDLTATTVEDAIHGGRRLLRSTSVYGGVIDAALAPEALADEAAHRDALDSLPPMSDSLVTRLGDHHDAVVTGEVAAMAQLDIPCHWFEGPDLLTDHGPRVPDFAFEPGSTHRRDRLARWTSGAGRRVDREAIRLSVESSGRVPAPPRPRLRTNGVPFGRDAVRPALAALADRLWADRLETSTGPTWLDIDGPNTDLRLVSHATDLYLGSDGIACAFAAMAVVLEDERWADAARRALWSPSPGGGAPGTDSTDVDLSIPDGLAGWIHARLVVGRLLADDALIETATRSVPHLLTPSPRSGPDLFGGAAGTLAVALTAAELRPDEHTCQVAASLATRFAESLDALAPGTVEHRRAELLSTAHGSIGISATLLRAAHQLDAPGLRDLADRHCERVETRVRERGGIGAKFVGSGSNRRPRADWCWGTAGYVVTRCQPFFDGEHWRDADHLAASAAVTAAVDVPDRHHLCCGLAGRLVAATCAAEIVPACVLAPGTNALVDELTRVAAGEEPVRSYVDTTVETDGLFSGRAGIGYALAHHLAPDRVPNLLVVA